MLDLFRVQLYHHVFDDRIEHLVKLFKFFDSRRRGLEYHQGVKTLILLLYLIGELPPAPHLRHKHFSSRINDNILDFGDRAVDFLIGERRIKNYDIFVDVHFKHLLMDSSPPQRGLKPFPREEQGAYFYTTGRKSSSIKCKNK